MLNMYAPNNCTFKLHKEKIDRSKMYRYVQRENAYNTGISVSFLLPKYQNPLVTKRTQDLFSQE